MNIIIIPCLAEENILATLRSLAANEGFLHNTLCWIVINHSELAPIEVKQKNHYLGRLLGAEIPRLNQNKLQFDCIEAFDLPHKKAGVGLARKTGMDKAAATLVANGHKKGIITCLDGDCTVAPNYLKEIEAIFELGLNGCSIFYEHPLSGENVEAITEYELYLRFYTNALRWCGFPGAFQTVGSAMAVTAEAYLKQGGMNTHKAGEDFYFLNKIIALGNFADLTTTTVFPSPRFSDRVPFGTGREMLEWQTTKKIAAYNPQLLQLLKSFFDAVPDFQNQQNVDSFLANPQTPSWFLHYLVNLGLKSKLEEIAHHTASPATFRKRFFGWMDAFQIMKMLNALSVFAPKVPISEAARWLAHQVGIPLSGESPKSLLLAFRAHDRHHQQPENHFVKASLKP